MERGPRASADVVTVDDDGLVVSVRVRLGPDGGHGDLERLLRLVDRLAAGDVDGAGGPDALRVSPRARVVYRGGREVVLTRREFDLLWHLVAHPRQVFSRTQLLECVWGHTFTSARNVDVQVRRVRVKIGTDLPLIRTVHGVGYSLGADVPVRIVDDPPGGRRNH
ncbi:Transcriptional regulatory protein, C terminal [Micromonospora phaseoli]|uniref:Transcriptional regulatory protein, C terminal n=1 Tax=Micromonospora phaseoli TaxID=1144548 RepID=A0A1H7C4T9_9ACTN|nr:transcriptional regulator [Micromonospora phaseoli]SEJ80635.1 Transcriptional regulatory protein, C terminal [Micromonospora phaseoli]